MLMFSWKRTINRKACCRCTDALFITFLLVFLLFLQHSIEINISLYSQTFFLQSCFRWFSYFHTNCDSLLIPLLKPSLVWFEQSEELNPAAFFTHNTQWCLTTECHLVRVLKIPSIGETEKLICENAATDCNTGAEIKTLT